MSRSELRQMWHGSGTSFFKFIAGTYDAIESDGTLEIGGPELD